MKRKVKRFDEGGYAALLANAQAYDREREGLPPMDDSASNDKGYNGSEAIQNENGTVNKLRRNTETGDLYNPEGNFPAPSSKTKARSAAAPVTRVSKTTRIEPIIPEDRASEEEVANKKSYESKGVGVGSSDVEKRGTGPKEDDTSAVTGLNKKSSTRAGRELSDEDRKRITRNVGIMGATAAAALIAPAAAPFVRAGLGRLMAKEAASKLNTVPMAKQLSGPSSTKMLGGPSTPKLLPGPRGETKLLTSNVSKASAENSPAIEQAMTGRSMSSGAIKRQSERDLMDNYRRGKSFGDRDIGYKSGGSVSSASSRGDGIAQRGKTRGKVC